MIYFKQKIQFFIVCFCIVLISIPFNLNAQVAPGGVSGNLKLWLKANKNVTPATQGAAVTNWNDQSGGTNNAVYGIPMFGAPVLNPTYQLNALNFNATVRFSGTSETNLSAIGGNLSPALTSNNISSYVVFLMNNASAASARVFMISQDAVTSDWENTAGADIISRMGSTNIYGSRNGISGPMIGSAVGKTVIASSHFTTGSQWLSEINGNTFSTAPFTATAFNAGYYRLGLSTYSNTEYLNGDIAEVILYDADKSSSAGHNQIESYLAIKYGIQKVGNYVNSSNVNIWDATKNATYHNDVFGIGQDDASGLLQNQSNSINTGSGDGTGQSAKGNIIISNPSSLINSGFLIMGHNSAALAEADLTVAGNLIRTVQRNWKVQSTGNPGTITLSYDITGLTYSAQSASDYFLLVDPTGTGDFSAGTTTKYPAAAITANKVSFNAVSLPDGAVFTFQTFSAPIVQATNVVFTNTTSTTTTASWTNGNGASRAVFVYAGANGSPAPLNYTTYTANAAFGTGTQIGTTGWYCVYNGIGTTVPITGLTPGTTYQVMAVEYNGTTASKEVYQTAIATGNPAAITTKSNIATLSNLTLSSGPLDPVFASAKIEYTATVENAISSVTLTPVVTQANATITINGVAVTSGSAFELNNLLVGPNVVTIEVTAQDRITKKIYTTTITRLPSTDASLINLLLSEGSLNPSFTTNGIEYSAVVKNNISTITVTPVSTDANATITINDAIVASGKASNPIDLIIGQTTITTAVMAQDDVTIKTYTITITRLASSDASLSDLSITDGDLKPSFSGDKTDYNVTVENAIDTFTVTPIANDANATMTINGVPVDNTASGTTIPLNVGDNTITIVVTAPDGTTIQTYTIHVYREGAQVVATNVITPNGDGINDFWVVKNLNAYPNNSVKVFDRAGRVVYSKNNYNNDWDGSYNGSPLSGNTYYYLINLGSNLPKIKGFITIIRD